MSDIDENFIRREKGVQRKIDYGSEVTSSFEGKTKEYIFKSLLIFAFLCILANYSSSNCNVENNLIWQKNSLCDDIKCVFTQNLNNLVT